LIFELALKRGRCYLFAAIGTAGIDVLEVRLLSGNQLAAADFQSRPAAWVGSCAEEDQEVRAEVAVLAGRGTVTGGWFDAARQDVLETVGPPLRAVSIPATLATLEASAALRLEKEGYVDVRPLADEAMAAGDRASHALWLNRGECVAILSFVAGLEDVDVEILRDGEVLVSDRTGNAMPEVGLCAHADAAYEVAIIAISGEGGARALIGYLPDIELPALPSPSTAYTAREAAARFKAGSLSPAGEAVILEPAPTGGYTAQLSLTGHQCYGVAIISSSALNRVSVQTGEDQPVAHWTGRAVSALLTVCPTDTGSFTVNAVIEADTGEGYPYLLIFHSGPL
jgi:hypothetical protein